MRSHGAGALALISVLVGALGSCMSIPSAEDVSSGRAPWDALTQGQKAAYMQEVVLPRMRSIFLEFDAHRYPKMDCVPCHQADHDTRGWKMPNPDLLVSKACISGTAQSIYGSEAAAAAMVRMTAFMRARVQPEMASLLGKPAFDDATGKGFGCFACHTMERENPVPIPPSEDVTTE